MAIAMKTLEATGFVDESGNLHLDEPLDMPPARVRISIFIDGDGTGDDGRLISVKQVCDFFVNKAKHLEVVQEIALVGEGVSIEIWTVTSTSRMDFEARYPIYDIQAEVACATDSAIVNTDNAKIYSRNVRDPRRRPARRPTLPTGLVATP